MFLSGMPLRDNVKSAQDAALKSRNSASLSTLRMLWSGVRTEEINQQKELDDAGVVAVVWRQIKQLEDSQKDFAAGGRLDLTEKAKAEIAILAQYLPVQMNDDELEEAVKAEIEIARAAGSADVGRVIGRVMKSVKGKADGNRVRLAVERNIKS